MRLVFVAFLFCLISPIVNADQFQLRKVIVCDKKEIIIRTLLEEFEERPVWSGHDANDNSHYILLSNDKTGSWTFVQYMNDIACVLGLGDNSKSAFGLPV
jgi:hypothetical protein